MTIKKFQLNASRLVTDHLKELRKASNLGPVLDLACGDCHNGIFLSKRKFRVVCCDRSANTLQRAKKLADECTVPIKIWKVDLESGGINPLQENYYGAILVFRYLHRPLMPCIKKAIKPCGIVLYETFTTAQSEFGRPHNPEYLLKPRELLDWFKSWEIIHYYEGIKENPRRAIAQIVCQKAAPDEGLPERT